MSNVTFLNILNLGKQIQIVKIAIKKLFKHKTDSYQSNLNKSRHGKRDIFSKLISHDVQDKL